MTIDEISQFLLANEEFFTTNNIIVNAFRWIGWGLVKILRSALEAGTTLYDYTFGLVDITNWTNLNDFIEQFRPLISALVLLSLVVLGFMFILGKHKKHTVLSSFLIFAIVMTSSNYIFSELNTMAVTFKDAVVNSGDQEDANMMVNANLYDILYIDREMGLRNMSPDNVVQYGQVSSEEINYIDINEVVNYNSDHLTTDEAKDILKQRILYIYGEPTVKEVSNGWGWNSNDDADLGNEFYYRYHFRFGTFYLTILSLILVLFCLAYKNVRIIYELFVSKILIFLFATDMSNNQKAVKILTSIRDGYYALCLTAVTLRSFTIFTSYLGTKTEINGLVRAIIILFITFCVIDGANIMEKITGVDAGLTGMTGKLLTSIQLTRAMQQGIQQSSMGRHISQQGSAISNLQNQMQSGSQNGMDGGNGMNAGNSSHSDSDQENRNSQDNLSNQNQMNNQENMNSHSNLNNQNQMDGQGNMSSQDAANSQESAYGQDGERDLGSQDNQGHESSIDNLNEQGSENNLENMSSQDSESNLQTMDSQENEDSLSNMNIEETNNNSEEILAASGGEAEASEKNNLEQENGSSIDQGNLDVNDDKYGKGDMNPYNATEKSMEQMSRDLENPENKYMGGAASFADQNEKGQHMDKSYHGATGIHNIPQDSTEMFRRNGAGEQQSRNERYPTGSRESVQGGQYSSQTGTPSRNGQYSAESKGMEQRSRYPSEPRTQSRETFSAPGSQGNRPVQPRNKNVNKKEL